MASERAFLGFFDFTTIVEVFIRLSLVFVAIGGSGQISVDRA